MLKTDINTKTDIPSRFFSYFKTTLLNSILIHTYLRKYLCISIEYCQELTKFCSPSPDELTDLFLMVGGNPMLELFC